MSAEYRVVAPRAAEELGNAARVEKVFGLTLEVIMRRFSAPLSELQAWAICHQCVKGLLALGPTQTVRDISMQNVVAATDGTVYFTAGSRGAFPSETTNKILMNDLGLLIFSLLDYGVKDDQEQPLSPSMEFLVESLTVQHGEEEEEEESDPEYWRGCHSPMLSSADSGISDDCTLILTPETLSDVLKVCEASVSWVRDHGTHFKTVCKSMVEEAVNISRLIQKSNAIDDGSRKGDEEKNRQWSEMIKQVKNGVPLKHVSESERCERMQPTLSQFDIFLMSIVKFDRSTLKPVSQTRSPSGFYSPSTSPAITQFPFIQPDNPHDSIMQQILARPRLRTVSESRGRYGNLPPRPLTPMEKLMADIKRPHTLKRVGPSQQYEAAMRTFKSASDLRYLDCDYSYGVQGEEEEEEEEEEEDSDNIDEDEEEEEEDAFVSDDELKEDGMKERWWVEEEEDVEKKREEEAVTSPLKRAKSLADIKPYTVAESALTSPSRTLQLDYLPTSPMHLPSLSASQHLSPSQSPSHSPTQPPPPAASPAGPSSVTTLWGKIKKAVSFRPKPKSESIFHGKQLILLTEQGSNGESNEEEELAKVEVAKVEEEEDEGIQQQQDSSSSNFEQVATGSQETMSLSNITLIRTTLAKAELYNTQLVDKPLFKELQKKKVCFKCKKRRFGFWTRPQICFLCNQSVCSQCTLTKEQVDIQQATWPQTLLPSGKISICQSCGEFVNNPDHL